MTSQIDDVGDRALDVPGGHTGMRGDLEVQIDDLLRHAVAEGASDVHLKVGSPPVIRVNGALRRMAGYESLNPADTEAYAAAIFIPAATTVFDETGAADFAYGRHDIGRFRVTVFRQRGSVSLVLRRVVAGSPSFTELGLPKIVEKIADSTSGLVLITGPSGSGKTTTMSSMIDWINANRSTTILTVEDPIEVLHPDKRSVVVQREVGVDTPNMAQAVRMAMRQDMNVILISEIEDAQTAQSALSAAETGHLVISSMRSADPAETLNRFVGLFSESQQPMVRSRLATAVAAVVSQRLIETVDSGRALACEVLTSNERAQDWILSGSDPDLLVDIIKESAFFGMQTFDQAILKLIEARTLELPTALAHVRNTHEVRAKAMQAGVPV